MTPRTQRERLEAVWRQKLHAAEEAYGKALAQTRQLQVELPFMPPSDGNVALAKALEFQSQAMTDYSRVLQTFTRLILYGEMPEENLEIPTAEPKPATDFDVQEWVFRNHSFVPHPAWIAHCKELYLGVVPETHSQECPPDKRLAVKEAFVALGMMRQP